MAKLTIIGLEKWLNSQNDSLFKSITLPEGIDKDLTVNEILLRCSEFEVQYPDPDFLKMATEHFFKKYRRTFEKWIEAYLAEYNPIENTDRYEEWTDKGTSEGKEKTNGTHTSNGSAEVTGNTTNLHDVTTDTSGTYKPESKDTTSSKDTTQNSNTLGVDDTRDTNGKTENKHVGHIHGNIGTMTVEQLLRGSYDIAKWNIYAQIADLYCADLCIGVYV